MASAKINAAIEVRIHLVRPYYFFKLFSMRVNWNNNPAAKKKISAFVFPLIAKKIPPAKQSST